MSTFSVVFLRPNRLTEGHWEELQPSSLPHPAACVLPPESHPAAFTRRGWAGSGTQRWARCFPQLKIPPLGGSPIPAPQTARASVQQPRRDAHRRADGHWVPVAAADCWSLPVSPSFCQCHVSKGTWVSISKGDWKGSTNPFPSKRLSNGIVYGTYGLRSGWIRNLNERNWRTWPKGPVVLGSNKVSSWCKATSQRQPHGSSMQRRAEREGWSTYLACQKDHMHPKKAEPKQTRLYS